MQDRLTELEGLSSTFGTAKVEAGERRLLVRGLFDRIAPRYDLMNDLMSLGLHRIWKRVAIAEAVTAASMVPGAVIDLAGGTGDLARELQRQLPGRLVINMDGSPGMAARALALAGKQDAIAVAEAEHLPLASDSVAAVTLSFGLRNMTDPAGALREVHRVLGRGGRLVLLEFSKPDAWFAPLYGLFSRTAIPALGAAVAGDVRAYRYLIESIRLYPDAESIRNELQRAGFRVERLRRFMFGVAALHVAVKA